MSEINIKIIDNKRIGVDTQSGVNGQTVAVNVNITDTGSLYTATTVEGALAEAMTTVNTKANQSTTYTKTEVNTALDLKANKVQEGWITPTLLNGWANVLTHPVVQYYKDTLGIVHFRGRAFGGGSNTVFLTLPAGYRPLVVQSVVLTNDAYNTILGDLQNTGNVRIQYSGLSTYVDLSGVTFRAEQ